MLPRGTWFAFARGMQPQILVPFDFSPASQRALAWAADLQSTTGGSPVHVIHVVTPPKVVAPEIPVPALSPEDVEQIAALLRTAVHKVEIAASTEVIVAGSVGSAILDSAAHVQAGLIVMGTHGRSGLKRLVLGSVAEHVVRNAGCPVVVMRPPEPAERPARAHA